MAGVTSNYPASIDSESNIIPPNNGDTLTVPGHWLAGNNGPIVNVQNELGTDPSGSFSTVKARLDSGLVTQADIWRLTASKATDGDITSNLERADSTSSGLLGTGMTESSGVFSFPETGIYLVTVQAYTIVDAPSDNIGLHTMVTTNNSSYSTQAQAVGHGSGGAGHTTVYSQLLIDVTDILNVKVKFYATSISSGNRFYGITDGNDTSFSFIRLGGT